MNNSSGIIERSLQGAYTAIRTELKPLGQEVVPLVQALGRVNAAAIFADYDKPFYSQALRDGFALADQPCALDTSFAEFQICGERAAGCTEQQVLQPGQAYKIMTGAMLPEKTARVVPFEVCQEEDSMLSVPDRELRREKLYIRPQGQDMKQGQCLIAAGTRISTDHLLFLAENGVQQINVHNCPRVVVLCTGNELIRAGQKPLPGQKISSNEILLASLLKEQGCTLVRSIRVQDDLNVIIELVKKVLAQDKPDLLITTGGTGPGKFDLMEQVVSSLHGSPLYNLLKIRPGKSTLFAMINGTPLLALPGPPPAVCLLFHELVVPGLDCLQGVATTKQFFTGLVDAVLAESMKLSRTGYLALKAARATLCDGQVLVRPAKRLEPMNAIMHLASPMERKKRQVGCREIKKNQRVKVRIIRPLEMPES
ncbi:molybdopterin molybdotransferase MoeA [Candidatus Electrothrix sp.]|uniref:molybdopterin molybdotransferase MoeA n=1 Tax=Candidatus Electrothrix sp. TaxID=2170559 RepID=UPI0040576C4B